MASDGPSDSSRRLAGEAAGRRLSLRWVAAVFAALILGFAVAPRGQSGLVVHSVDDGNISLLVPAGWKTEGLVAPHGTAISGWFDAGNPENQEIVQASDPERSSPQARIRALAAQLAHRSGYTPGYLGTVVFPGGRRAWTLLYALKGAAFAVFDYDVCGPPIAMTVTLSASSAGKLRDNAAVLPQSAFAICNGTAFTSPDRADLAIPLSLPA